MESQSFSQKTCNSKGHKGPPRRTWKDSEELGLLQTLKEMVADGWKCDNGFKNGFLNACEQGMAKKFPGCDLKGDPHIHSKLTVWKKQYNSLTSMLSRSGIGWNSSSCTIDCPDDSIWDDYIKFDEKARNMRHKTWPFFKDWMIVFGKDRATGNKSTSFVETINNLVSGTNMPDAIPLDDETADAENFTPEADNVSFSTGTQSNNSQSGKRKRGSCRSGVTNREDPKMVEMMEKFFKDVHIQIGTLISKVGHEHDAATARRGVFDALEELPYLTVDQKLDAAKAICRKQEYVDIFYGLSTDNKAHMVQRILGKSW